MLTLDTLTIGLRSAPRSVTVSEQAIRDFATAIGDFNPLYHDATVAHTCGYRNIIAPPTFATIFGFNRIPGLDLPLAPLEVPISGIIYLDQAFSYGLPVTAGDTITTTGWVTRIRTGGLTTLYLASEGLNQQQCMVFQASAAFLIPPDEQ